MRRRMRPAERQPRLDPTTGEPHPVPGMPLRSLRRTPPSLPVARGSRWRARGRLAGAAVRRVRRSLSRGRDGRSVRRPEDLRRRDAERAARRHHGGLRAGEGPAGIRFEGLCRPSFRAAFTTSRRLYAPAGSGRPRLYPRRVGHAAAQTGSGRAFFLAASLAASLCRSWRPFQRDLLLGQLLRNAGPRAGRTVRSRPRHARQHRIADRALRPRAERQPQLLSQPFPAAFFLTHGRTHRRARRRRRLRPVSSRSSRPNTTTGWTAPRTSRPASAARHVVRLPDGTLFNRYWDDRAAPRDESYREDVETARRAGRPAEEVYRDLRAGAESGWDFSSRWLADGKTLSTIRTTDIAPVDLNAVMVHLERTLAKAYRLKGDMEAARRRQADADRRSEAIRRS